jgi:hypothetical protein
MSVLDHLVNSILALRMLIIMGWMLKEAGSKHASQ